MHKVNRMVSIIRPKQPFIRWANWANKISGDGIDHPDEYFQSDCTIILIPEYNDNKEACDYINTIWERVFETEM